MVSAVAGAVAKVLEGKCTDGADVKATEGLASENEAWFLLIAGGLTRCCDCPGIGRAV